MPIKLEKSQIEPHSAASQIRSRVAEATVAQ